VRERAPVSSASGTSGEQPPAPVPPATPAPEPVVTEVGDTKGTDQPRRSGWWSRRFAGD
jgi:hypothetical protein